MSYAKTLEPSLEALAPSLTRGEYRLLRSVRVRSKRLGIIGVIDAVLLAQNEAIPIEAKLKASRRGLYGRQKHILAQLVAYSIAVEETLKKTVRKAAVISIEDNRAILIQLRPWMRQWIENLVEELRRNLEKPKPPEPTNTTRCRACGLRRICPYAKH